MRALPVADCSPFIMRAREGFPADTYQRVLAFPAFTMQLGRNWTDARMEDGRIRIDWSIEEGPGPRLRLAWAEMNGPSIQPPTRRGFGSSLIEQSITRELGGTLVNNFDATGLVGTIPGPLDRLTSPARLGRAAR